ncbi:hypothetical protein MMC19_002838 [Ptychographa xylographoides]|nr:hypothetical protein [Ptychographa xylographoides]
MDPSTQKYVLDLIYGKCTVIHPPRETLITLLAADITESSGGAPAKQLFQNADTEAVLGDGADLQEATRTEFWDFQKTLSSVTADHPSYERAFALRIPYMRMRPIDIEDVSLETWSHSSKIVPNTVTEQTDQGFATFYSVNPPALLATKLTS